jgi:hypothetical protein
MSSSFGVLVAIVEKLPGTFPFEPTKKAASPRGLDVSPEAAALLSAHRWTFSASQRSNAVSPFPNSSFVPDRPESK